MWPGRLLGRTQKGGWGSKLQKHKCRAQHASDVSLHPEAYQKQADIIPAKILHQLCLPQVTGAESAENQRKREGERGGKEGPDLIYTLRAEGFPSSSGGSLRGFPPRPGDPVSVFSTD